MFTLLSNKTFLAGVAVGFVAGYAAYRYMNTDVKTGDKATVAKEILGLAAKVGGVAVAGRACGMGMNMMRNKQ